MKKILHPTDFSEQMLPAFEYCVEFARKVYGNIVLMHVNPMLESMDVPFGYIHINQDTFEQIARERYQELRTEIQRIDPSIPSKMVTTLGGVVPEIIRTAEDEEVDLILMGTNGADGIKRWLGTNSSQVMNLSHCPILIIPLGYAFKGIQKIAYASNYLEEDEDILKEVASLAGFLEAELHIVHIAPEAASNYEIYKFSWFEEKIKQRVPKLKPLAVQYEFLNHPNPHRALNEFVVLNEMDLLVMTRNKRNLLQQFFQRSQTQEMSLDSMVPLLVYHQE
ncbi:MAG: universal stress protein [Bacteroidota bacterium]